MPRMKHQNYRPGGSISSPHTQAGARYLMPRREHLTSCPGGSTSSHAQEGALHLMPSKNKPTLSPRKEHLLASSRGESTLPQTQERALHHIPSRKHLTFMPRRETLTSCPRGISSPHAHEEAPLLMPRRKHHHYHPGGHVIASFITSCPGGLKLLGVERDPLAAPGRSTHYARESVSL